MDHEVPEIVRVGHVIPEREAFVEPGRINLRLVVTNGQEISGSEATQRSEVAALIVAVAEL